MTMQRLTSKANFAEKVGVSRSAVTQATAEGGALFFAVHNGEIDLEHESTKAYLFKKKNLKFEVFLNLGYSEEIFAEYQAARQPGAKPKKTAPAQRPAPVQQPVQAQAEPSPRVNHKNFHDNDSLMDYYGQKTLFEILREFGTDDNFKRFVDSLKTLAEIEKRKIEIAKSRGEVVDRELVRKHLFGAIESGNLKLLQDLPGNIARHAFSAAKAEQPVEDVEREIQRMISLVLADVKASAQRGLKYA